MKATHPISPRRRLQVLLAIPERQRTEAEWDEINELEIALAPGNRMGVPEQSVRSNAAKPAGHTMSGSGAHNKKPIKKFRRKLR